jgi:hypothetical protein
LYRSGNAPYLLHRTPGGQPAPVWSQLGQSRQAQSRSVEQLDKEIQALRKAVEELRDAIKQSKATGRD